MIAGLYNFISFASFCGVVKNIYQSNSNIWHICGYFHKYAIIINKTSYQLLIQLLNKESTVWKILNFSDKSYFKKHIA